MPAQTEQRRATRRGAVQRVAVGLAGGATWVLLISPSGTEVTTSSSGTETTRSLTLLESSGPPALIGLTLPVLLTLVPLLVRGRWSRPLSVASAVLLGGFVVLAMLSIGWFYVPALLAEIVALVLPEEPRTEASSGGDAAPL